MQHVRDYLDTIGGRRGKAEDPSPSPVVLVHAYVSELEMVIAGIESHAQVLARLRMTAMGALDALQAREDFASNPILRWYAEAAVEYIALLELRIGGGEVLDHSLKQSRLWYERMKQTV